MNNLFNTNDVRIVAHDLRRGALSVSANLLTHSEELLTMGKLMGLHVTSLKVRAHVQTFKNGSTRRNVHLYVHQNLGQRDPHMSISFAKGVDGLMDRLAQRTAGLAGTPKAGLTMFTGALAAHPEVLPAVTAAADEAFTRLAAMDTAGRVQAYLDMVEARLDRPEALRSATRRLFADACAGRPSAVLRRDDQEAFAGLGSDVQGTLTLAAIFAAREAVGR